MTWFGLCFRKDPSEECTERRRLEELGKSGAIAILQKKMNSFERDQRENQQDSETGVEVREGGEKDDSQILGLSNRVDDNAIH